MALVGRAVGCLASNYTYLRGISQNKPPDEVAESIARAVAECAEGGIDAIKSDILKYRSQVARAFKALGLPRSATHSVRSIPVACMRWARVISVTSEPRGKLGSESRVLTLPVCRRLRDCARRRPADLGAATRVRCGRSAFQRRTYASVLAVAVDRGPPDLPFAEPRA